MRASSVTHPRITRYRNAALAALCCLAVPLAAAQTTWLTVMGEPADASVNTIQVNPVPLEVRDSWRTMVLRVSRSAPRTSWDGVPYRSYNARVLFDCKALAARYLWIEYFAEPAWRGAPHKAVDYSRGEPRPMAFRDVQPNPTARIVRAACGAGG